MDTETTVPFTKPVPFEDLLFTYKQTRVNGIDLEFRHVTLKVDVGEWKAGTFFEESFLSTAGVLGLKTNDGKVFTYHLSVVVGEKIDTEALMNSCGCGACPSSGGCEGSCN